MRGRWWALTGAAVFAAMVSASCGDVAEPTTGQPPEGTEPAAAFGIGAAPGPSERSITVTWSPVDGAGSYALYVATSPGVSPQSATRIVGVTTGFTHTDLAPGETYYYIVAGIDGDFEGAPSAEISSTPRSGVGFRLETPTAGAIVGADVPMVVDVSTSGALGSLTASVGSVDAPLTFDASIGRWTGTLSLESFVSPSARVVRLVALGVGGERAEGEMIVRLDVPPAVAVASPADQELIVANSVRITATCADDAAAGCTELVAYVPGFRGTPLASGTAALDELVSLVAFPASEIQILVEGVDSRGQVVRVTRVVRRE